MSNPVRGRLNAGFFRVVDRYVHHVLGERKARLFAEYRRRNPTSSGQVDRGRHMWEMRPPGSTSSVRAPVPGRLTRPA
jgi:hypothetical protein